MRSENKRADLLAGQRLMVGFDGIELNQELRTLIKDMKIGGIILFAGNIKSANQVMTLCKSAQEYAESCNLPPLFIAVDQEGGDVARLKKPDFTEFQGNPHIMDLKSAKEFATVTANELKAVHINMDLAPVMDSIPEIPESGEVERDHTNAATLPYNGHALTGTTKSESPIITTSLEDSHIKFRSIMASRVFPGSPENVGKLGSHVIETLQNSGIMAVAKHFPGIGRTTKDSHLELPILDADKELMKKSDLIPFQYAIKSNVAGIMLSHILYSAMDREWPASLSYDIARRLLRDQMGYQGVVMTDDLDMKAIRCDIRTSVRQILNAEIDITLICHKGADIETAFQEIKSLISTDKILYNKGVESAQRIAALKKAYLRS